MNVKVLLDTDIGSDIDDAVCLSYLLANPYCDLLGITTTSGQAKKRARLASALCLAAGKDVPIRVGADEPLLVSQQQPETPQEPALSSWPHLVDFPDEPAVEFMRRMIHDHPGEVVLLTIGPLTNVALLFAIDPEIPRLLKGMVSMAGSFWSGVRDGLEWNIACDPHAAAMVYHANPPYHWSVGLDVTTQVTMQVAEFRKRFNTDHLRPVLDFAQPWFKSREIITFHDPLAAAVIFNQQLCEFETGAATVHLDGTHLPGVTTWSPGPRNTGQSVAVSVDPASFFKHYFVVTDLGSS